MKHLSSLLLCACISASATAQVTHTVMTENMQFVPSLITIAPGDSIRFLLLEADGTEHSALQIAESTWDMNGTEPVIGFNIGSGTINPSLDQTVGFPDEGELFYICFQHADMGMKGRIIVTDEVSAIHEEGMPQLGLYPNPADTQIRWSWPDPRSVVQVYTNDGRVALRARPNGLNTLDIRGLAAGLYQVVLMDDAGAITARQQLMVTH